MNIRVRRWSLVLLRTASLTCAVVLAGCHRPEPRISSPLPQCGYLWQRNWTPAVIDSLTEAHRRMDGVMILGAEIVWTGRNPNLVAASIDWEALKRTGIPCGIALRIAPFSGPFAEDDASARFIVEVAKPLLEQARAYGVKLCEFQLDFDCSQKNLSSYRAWLRVLRPAIHPVRFVVTTLPAWLDEPAFFPLVNEADGYVLQVHSVPILSENGSATLCDPTLVRKWITKAAALGMPFSVSLPTYRCTAGYNPMGKLLGVAMDGVQPAWPPDTRILEFGAVADDLAELVNEWQRERPPQLRELLWYRVPVATDTRNWRWVTLAAVMAGRKPMHQLEVLQEGGNPVDVSIVNSGEADEQLNPVIIATWEKESPVTADALTGWTVNLGKEHATFAAQAGRPLRLPPGAKRRIGWLRYDHPTNVQLRLAKQNEASR